MRGPSSAAISLRGAARHLPHRADAVAAARCGFMSSPLRDLVELQPCVSARAKRGIAVR